MDLATAANIATTVAVVVAVLFGVVELRVSRRQRRDEALIEIVRLVQSVETRRQIERILELPNDADPQLIKGDPELYAAAIEVHWACEMFGFAVFEGVLELHALDRVCGGWIRQCWKRQRRWMEEDRKLNPNSGEWWQWLVERLEADPDPGKAQAAYIAYKGRAGR